jgi:hypothetical protein
LVLTAARETWKEKETSFHCINLAKPFASKPWLPDDTFSTQKSQFGSILEDLAMEEVGTFYGHFVNFAAIWYIFPLLVCRQDSSLSNLNTSQPPNECIEQVGASLYTQKMRRDTPKNWQQNDEGISTRKESTNVIKEGGNTTKI